MLASLSSNMYLQYSMHLYIPVRFVPPIKSWISEKLDVSHLADVLYYQNVQGKTKVAKPSSNFSSLSKKKAFRHTSRSVIQNLEEPLSDCANMIVCFQSDAKSERCASKVYSSEDLDPAQLIKPLILIPPARATSSMVHSFPNTFVS